ncbi:alpha/beta fold hydrolase [Thermosulfurimonas sp. F29]|uniref:alpha/beta fold hydrolase n=1 Tax=Thermosulfurimonas sp. F29 TaxID=2867247 RepID=UPI001C83484D|nr:alpha/beta fold hydrolase [Thermosulfurimonas sp. F29]MBX6423195.1 DUF452 family protein [Thermosulfurimonas sp. F29]
MRLKLLGNPEARNLLILFNGWAMDERPFLSLLPEGVRVAVLFDYRDLSLPELPRVPGRTLVLAWSLGVYAALHHAERLPARFVFLAGTGAFRDRLYGIDPRALDLTLEALKRDGPPVLERFYRRMFADEEHARRFRHHLPRRKLSEVIEELEMAAGLPPLFPELPEGTRIFVPTGDRIVPPPAQERFWRRLGGEYRPVPGGHFPFYAFRDLIEWFGDVP